MTLAIKGWFMAGVKDQYSAEITGETREGKRVVRMWRSAEGDAPFGAMAQYFSAVSCAPVSERLTHRTKT